MREHWKSPVFGFICGICIGAAGVNIVDHPIKTLALLLILILAREITR